MGEALERIVRSAPFRGSKQCQLLLRYVVDHSIEGREELLRERVIGSEVFGRKPDYDAANDPIVRARMAEVRKRLAQYYQSEGLASPLRIQIPSGSYLARFASLAAAAPASAAQDGEHRQVAEAVPAEPLAGRRFPRRRLATVAAVLLILSAVGILIWRDVRPSPARLLDRFWEPALSSPMPVFIYTGTNVVYRFTPEFMERYREAHHLPNTGLEFPVDLQSLKTIDPQDLAVFADTFIGEGDVSACTTIASMLARHNKRYEMRYAGDISSGDLHSAPTVLIGAFSNRWTLSVTEGMRYRFVRGTTIEDRFDPHRSWSIRTKPDGATIDDYAVVSRILAPKSGGAVLTAAGIGQYGTQAASEYLVNSQRIAEFAKRAPRDWPQKNVQILLHVKVVDEIPVSIDILGLYFW